MLHIVRTQVDSTHTCLFMVLVWLTCVRCWSRFPAKELTQTVTFEENGSWMDGAIKAFFPAPNTQQFLIVLFRPYVSLMNQPEALSTILTSPTLVQSPIPSFSSTNSSASLLPLLHHLIPSSSWPFPPHAATLTPGHAHPHVRHPPIETSQFFACLPLQPSSPPTERKQSLFSFSLNDAKLTFFPFLPRFLPLPSDPSLPLPVPVFGSGLFVLASSAFTAPGKSDTLPAPPASPAAGF